MRFTNALTLSFIFTLKYVKTNRINENKQKINKKIVKTN